jgi:putative phosphoesterase
MKIAFISDIHSNIFALKSVITHMKKLNINKICILGDIIDYYYYPDEVLATLLDDDFDIISIIKGNHEDNLTFLFNNKDQLDDYTNKYGHGMEKVFNNCTKEQIEYLINLKEKDELNINNLKIGLFHGSIESNKEHIYPDAQFDVLKKQTDQNFDFIFLGHTHMAFSFNYNNTTVINVGSIGKNRVSSNASWVYLNTENKVVQFMTTDYNKDELIKDIIKYDNDKEYLKLNNT